MTPRKKTVHYNFDTPKTRTVDGIGNFTFRRSGTHCEGVCMLTIPDGTILFQTIHCGRSIWTMVFGLRQGDIRNSVNIRGERAVDVQTLTPAQRQLTMTRLRGDARVKGPLSFW